MSLKLRRVLMGTGIALVLAVGVMVLKPGSLFVQADAATDYQQLQKFSRVMEMVRRAYVKDVSDENLAMGRVPACCPVSIHIPPIWTRTCINK